VLLALVFGQAVPLEEQMAADLALHVPIHRLRRLALVLPSEACTGDKEVVVFLEVSLAQAFECSGQLDDGPRGKACSEGREAANTIPNLGVEDGITGEPASVAMQAV